MNQATKGSLTLDRKTSQSPLIGSKYMNGRSAAELVELVDQERLNPL